MTLSSSDIDSRYKSVIKTGFVYLGLSLFCALFGAVYEHFSYDVYSYYMIYAFAFPLVGGVCVFFTMAFTHRKVPSRLSMNLYNSGIATLTVGSIIKGVFDIYGTSNSLVIVYLVAGCILVVIGVITYVLLPEKANRK